MKKLIIGVLAITPLLCCGQTQEAKDSLISVMCKTITDNTSQNDSIRIFAAYRKHLYPFLERFAEDKRKEIGTSIYFRMQMTCGSFKEILMKAEPPNEEFEKIIERPTKFPGKKTCRDFIAYKSYLYRESTGDTVQLTIKNNFWIEKFKDGTYSKLKFYCLTDCEFELEFIESNNKIRSGLSKKGDKYKYYITSKGSDHFDLAVDIKETNKLLGFKIYHSQN
jgi:hypothetical protein